MFQKKIFFLLFDGLLTNDKIGKFFFSPEIRSTQKQQNSTVQLVLKWE